MRNDTTQRLRYRLTDERRHRVGTLCQDRRLYRPCRLNCTLLFTARPKLAPIEVWSCNMHNMRRLRLVIRTRKSRMVSKPHRPIGRTMIRTTTRYHLVTPSVSHPNVVSLRKLQRRLVGLRAALTEECARQVTRCEMRQTLRKTNRRRRNSRIDIHRHRGELVVDRTRYLIAAITDVAEIHARDAVDVADAIRVVEVDALSTVHDHRTAILRQLGMILHPDEEMLPRRTLKIRSVYS